MKMIIIGLTLLSSVSAFAENENGNRVGMLSGHVYTTTVYSFDDGKYLVTRRINDTDYRETSDLIDRISIDHSFNPDNGECIVNVKFENKNKSMAYSTDISNNYFEVNADFKNLFKEKSGIRFDEICNQNP